MRFVLALLLLFVVGPAWALAPAPEEPAFATPDDVDYSPTAYQGSWAPETGSCAKPLRITRQTLLGDGLDCAVSDVVFEENGIGWRITAQCRTGYGEARTRRFGISRDMPGTTLQIDDRDAPETVPETHLGIYSRCEGH